MFYKLVCLALGHRISRRRVSHDGVVFRTTCKRCGTGMVRRDGGWRVDKDGAGSASTDHT